MLITADLSKSCEQYDIDGMNILIFTFIGLRPWPLLGTFGRMDIVSSTPQNVRKRSRIVISHLCIDYAEPARGCADLD